MESGGTSEWTMRSLEKGDVFNDRYEILYRLGVGGMGEVFYARDRKLLRDVALKILQLPSDEAWSANPAAIDTYNRRFEQEAQAIAQLEHPHIIAVYDYGVDRGIRYLTMPYFPGVPISLWG